MKRLQEITGASPWVFLGLLGDAIATNLAVITRYAKDLPGCIIDAGRCTMHQGHLAFCGGGHNLDLVAPLHCLGCSFKASSNQRKLQKSLWTVAKTVNIRFAQPPDEAARYANFVLEFTICDFAGYHSLEDEARRAKILQRMQAMKVTILTALNGRWWLELEHFCWRESDGAPCCASPEVSDAVGCARGVFTV